MWLVEAWWAWWEGLGRWRGTWRLVFVVALREGSGFSDDLMSLLCGLLGAVSDRAAMLVRGVESFVSIGGEVWLKGFTSS